MTAEQDYAAMVTAKGKKFLDGLKWLQGRHKEIGEVDGLGLALRIEVCEAHDSFTPNKKLLDKMSDIALSGGAGAQRQEDRPDPQHWRPTTRT